MPWLDLVNNMAADDLAPCVPRPSADLIHSEYCKISNIRCTKSQNLSDSRPVLQLSLLNLLKPRVKSRMKM